MRPLETQRFMLKFKAVLIRCLDKDKKPILNSTASGFIVKDNGKNFLYTCWHVVTGYNKYDLKFRYPPTRKYLQIELQDSDTNTPGFERIGGIKTLTLPLYDKNEHQEQPLWEQDYQHLPNPDLNSINIFVPYWHDAIRIELPDSISPSLLQVINSDDIPFQLNLLTECEKLIILGYPYGFSTQGAAQPTPIALTRYVASSSFQGIQRILIDGTGAPGMSGGPVFLERNNQLSIVGVYTGLIYPDFEIEQAEKTTALGTCCNLLMHWSGSLKMVRVNASNAIDGKL